MTEPSSGVPSEIADAEVDQADHGERTGEGQGDEQAGGDRSSGDQPDRVELDIDEEKMQAWDEVKSDYQVDPDHQENRLPGSDEQGVDEGESFEG
jgi:hypothetical protein